MYSATLTMPLTVKALDTFTSVDASISTVGAVTLMIESASIPNSPSACCCIKVAESPSISFVVPIPESSERSSPVS